MSDNIVSIFGSVDPDAVGSIVKPTPENAAPSKPPLVPTDGYTLLEIDPDGDLLVEILQPASRPYGYRHPYPMTPEKRVAFKVNRDLISSKSRHLHRMTGGYYVEARMTKIELTDESVTAMELWFRHFAKVMTPEMYNISSEEVWNVIEAGRKRQFQTLELMEWFSKWWEIRMRNWTALGDEEDGMNEKYNWMLEALYPAYFFNHKLGFAHATKFVAYESTGHIVETNPSHHRHLKLRDQIIQSLRAVKGSMRVNIHKGVFGKTQEKFQSLQCDCRFKASYNFDGGILKTRVTSDDAFSHKLSIRQLIEGLAKFEYTAPEDACGFCGQDFTSQILLLRENIDNYFHGLCLDCLDLTKKWDWYKTFWYLPGNGRNHISDRCEFPHGQPTWYFSNMARHERIDLHETDRQTKAFNDAEQIREREERRGALQIAAEPEPVPETDSEPESKKRKLDDR